MLLEGFGDRLESEINSKYDGNMSAFIRRCKEIDPDAAPADGTSVKKYYSGSVPGLDKVIVMAGALDMTVDQLLGIKQPPNQNGTGADVDEKVFNTSGVKSVKPPPAEEEAAHTYPGFAVRGGGRDQLVIDLVIRGRKDRAVIIDVGAREENANG